MAKSNSGGLQGAPQTQLSDLVEGMKDLHVKLDATLEFTTLIRSDLIQNFNGIQIEGQRRERETFQAVQKLCDIMGQGTGTKADGETQ